MPLSPLDLEAETDDATVAELFARDPMQLSDQDLDTIITKLRAQRHRFVLGDKKAGTPGSKKRAAPKITEKQAEALKVTGDLDLGDLNL